MAGREAAVLNYIKAELWKALRHRIFWGTTIFLVLCTALFGVLMNSADYVELVGGVSVTMLTGMLVVPLLVQVVDGGRGETMKNEISFGLSRGGIYGGKLLSGLLLGLGLCAVLLVGLLGICAPLLPHGDPEAETVALWILGFCLLAAVPVWCGMFALCHAMAMLFPGAAVWMTAYYLLFFVGQPILAALSSLFTGGSLSPLLQAILMPYTLLMPPYLSGWLTWEYQLWCWGIGLGWGGASTLVGLLWFFRRDIR